MTYTELRERILTAIPGYEEAIRRDENAGKQLADPTINPTYPAAYAEVQAKIAELLDAGDDIPSDIAVPAAAAETYDRALMIRKQILSGHKPTINGFRTNFVAVNADAALTALRSELATVVEQVKQIASSLDGVGTADDAIEAGSKATAAWLELRALRDQYDSIRRLQFDLYQGAVMDATGDTLAHTGLFAESIDVVPYFVQRRLKNASTSYNYTPAAQEYIEWMREAEAAWTVETDTHGWPTINREAHLILACTRLTPWIPSTDDVQNALTTANLATLPIDTEQPHFNEKARADHYAITKPPTGAVITTTLKPAPRRGRAQRMDYASQASRL